MRAFVLAAAALSLSVLSAFSTLSCKIPSRLEGRWKGVRADGVPPETQLAANTFAAGMRLEIRGNRITVATPKETQTGTFRVVKDTVSSVVIATDRGDGDETFALVDDKTLRWEVSPPRSITFRRE